MRSAEFAGVVRPTVVSGGAGRGGPCARPRGLSWLHAAGAGAALQPRQPLGGAGLERILHGDASREAGHVLCPHTEVEHSSRAAFLPDLTRQGWEGVCVGLGLAVCEAQAGPARERSPAVPVPDPGGQAECQLVCGVRHALSRELQAHDAAEASLHPQEGLQDLGNPAGSPQGRCVCLWILSVSKDTPGSWDNALGGHEVTSIWGEKQGFVTSP